VKREKKKTVQIFSKPGGEPKKKRMDLAKELGEGERVKELDHFGGEKIHRKRSGECPPGKAFLLQIPHPDRPDGG